MSGEIPALEAAGGSVEPKLGREPRRQVPLHTKILIGLIAGILLGLLANYLGSRPVAASGPDAADVDANGIHDRLDLLVAVAKLVGQVFLRLMFMVVLPLVFSALALAVVEIGDIRQLGRVGWRTLAFTLVFSFTAVVLGLVLVNTIRPGKILPPEQRERLKREYGDEAAARGDAARIVAQSKSTKPIGQTLLDIIPENPLQEMVGAVDGSSKGNGMLAVMFFALMFGAAMTIVPEKTETLVGWLQGLYAVAMTVIGWAMRLAPVGAGCLVFAVTATLGLDILKTLAGFIGTVLLGLTIHLIVTYSIMLRLFSRFSPPEFFRGVREAMLTAFGTSSSSATLPTALRVAEKNLRLPPKISNFVLTVGATGNQNGTALYEGVVVLFLAQVFDVNLTVPQQVMVVLMSVLAGVGTAGVPGGSLPLIVVVMQSVPDDVSGRIPAEGIGIILGVDRILDMCRTVLNVTGDLAVAACVAGTEVDPQPPPL
jgi:DAACS family dicarboxylate/amino acid:cation (Na+ or H+) symporter